MNADGAVEQLLAKQAIREVLQNYCRAIDRFDAPLGRSVWHAGATVDFVGIFTGTAEGWMSSVFEAHRGFSAHSHQVTNVTIALDGDTAASEAYVTARLRSKDESGRLVDMVVAGRYLDRWSRRDGVWAIDHRTYVNDVHSQYEVLSSMEETTARRDGNDPSYALLGSTVGY